MILNSREPKLELPLLVQFLPALMSLIVDDQVRSLNSKLPVEERDTAGIIIDHSGPPPDMYDVQVRFLVFFRAISTGRN